MFVCVWDGVCVCVVITFGHGLEIHLAAVASEAGHGSRPHREDVDGTGLQAADDRRVGLTAQHGGVILRQFLRGEREEGEGERMNERTNKTLRERITENNRGKSHCWKSDCWYLKKGSIKT